MKITILFFLMFSLLAFTCNKNSHHNIDDKTDSETDLAEWKLVWNDEFSEPSIDLTRWEHEVNAQGGGNSELQYYTDRPENSFIRESCLVIQARAETYNGPEGTREFTSARLRTLNKGDWKYGRFDIRAKLPYSQGLWPAIWMLPSEWVYGGWAASGEIDIMELLGQDPEKVYGTLHYGGTYPNNTHSGSSYTLSEGTFAQDFHLFTLEWDSTEMRWYVDGQHYLTQKNWYSTAAEYPAPFDQKFHLLLNVAVGGNWPGNPDLTTILPQEMVIDYVRVYEKEK